MRNSCVIKRSDLFEYIYEKDRPHCTMTDAVYHAVNGMFRIQYDIFGKKPDS